MHYEDLDPETQEVWKYIQDNARPIPDAQAEADRLIMLGHLVEVLEVKVGPKKGLAAVILYCNCDTPERQRFLCPTPN